jgi:O-antigen/teichoic acid export membrane protein
MKLGDAVTFNTAVQLAGKAFVSLSALLLLALLTRSLGKEGYGAYITIFNWMVILLVFADLGLYLTGVRELSRVGADEARIAGNLISLRLLSGLLVAGIACLVLVFMPYGQRVQMGMGLALLFMLFVSMTNAFKSIFQVRLRMHYAVYGEVGAAAATLLLSFAALQAGLGLMAVVTAAVTGSLVNLSLSILFSRQLIALRPHWDASVIRNLLRGALPLGFSAVMAVLYLRVDLLMLSWMKPLDDVGIYGAAYSIVETSTIVPALFLVTLLPLFTRAIDARDKSLDPLYLRAFNFLTYLAVPMLLGGLVLADPLMKLITGGEFMVQHTFPVPFRGPVTFAAAAVTFQILLIATAQMFWGQLNGHLIIAANLQRKLLYIYFILVPANVALNLLLIPQYSYLGAAFATAATEVIALGYTTWVVLRTLKQTPKVRSLARAAIACIPMTLFVWLVDLHVILSVACGALIYGLSLYLLGGFREESTIPLSLMLHGKSPEPR